MPIAATPAAQPELDFTVSPAPKVGAGDVVNLCYLLRGRGWRTAAQISAAVVEKRINGGRPWADRHVRAIAEASDGAVVSYPGSPGYCLFDECPPEQLVHAALAMESQGKRMIARGLAIRTRARRLGLVDRPQG